MIKIKSKPTASAFVLIGIPILTFGFVYIFKSIMPFDGIEFNGDSYRYYISSLNIYDAVNHLDYPAPAFWPYGFPVLAGLLFHLIGSSFEHAQLISILTGTGLMMILFLMARMNPDLSGQSTMSVILSLLIIFFCGYILKYQMMIMSDIAALFWASLSIYFLLKYGDGKSKVYLFLVSFSLAFAILTRYVYGLMLVPVFFALWADRKSFASLALEVGLLSLLVFVFCIPQLILNLPSTETSFHHPWIQNWSFANFWIMDRTTTDGHLQVQIPNFVYYLLSPFRHSEFTVAGLIISFLGFILSLKSRSGTLSKIMILWFLVFYLFLCGIPIQNARFALSLYVPIFFFHVEFFRYVLAGTYRKVIIAFSLTFILVKVFFSVSFLINSINAKNEMLKTGTEFLALAPSNALIISWDFYEAYHIYFPQQKIETIHGLTKENASALLNEYRSVLLIFDEERLENAWGSLPPAETYQWLKRNFEFHLILQKGRYSVWKYSRETGPSQ